MFKKTSTANDNVPNGYDSAQLSRIGSVIMGHGENAAHIRGASPLRASKPPIYQMPETLAEAPAERKTATSTLFTLASFAWLATIAANIWAISAAPSPGLHMILAVMAILTSLWVTYFSAKAVRPALHELSAMSAVLAFAVSLYVTNMRFGVIISPIAGAGLTALAALGVGMVAQSVMALRLSAIFGAVWAGLGFTAVGVKPFLWGFPALLSLQLFAAQIKRDGQTFTLSVLSGYFWILGTAYLAFTGGLISALQLTSLLFLIGALHLRAGKLMQDMQHEFGLTQTNLGWMAMITGLLGVQDFWLSPLRAPWLGLPVNITGQSVWVIIAIAIIVCICAIELRRVKTRPQTLTLALFSTLLCATIAALAVQASTAAELLQGWGANPMPNLGLTLGAVVTAAAAAMIVNGIRRGKTIMVLIGALAILAQTVIVLEHISQNADQALFFGAATFICVLCTALFAGSAEDHSDYAEGHL